MEPERANLHRTAGSARRPRVSGPGRRKLPIRSFLWIRRCSRSWKGSAPSTSCWKSQSGTARSSLSCRFPGASGRFFEGRAGRLRAAAGDASNLRSPGPRFRGWRGARDADRGLPVAGRPRLKPGAGRPQPDRRCRTAPWRRALPHLPVLPGRTSRRCRAVPARRFWPTGFGPIPPGLPGQAPWRLDPPAARGPRPTESASTIQRGRRRRFVAARRVRRPLSAAARYAS